ncbi:putative neural-cadherin 2 [Penaeus chinensis]|uniref:putative neural-cadherin 2 n=1 Tax=Penaeus chinensis TaxID=139456 RepID=UPI001FB70A06|nr:putative neural-cadherin 2 [Penaeus chinensis]
MAINVVIPLLIPLEENLHNATRLLSEAGGSRLEFTEVRYCAVIPEDAGVASDVTTVMAIPKNGESVTYSITGGNRDGLFSIDQSTGTISVAAPLDYELQDKHELVVGAWASAGGWAAHAVVEVEVADVNDHAPFFVRASPQVTLIEEDDRDLPASVLKVGVLMLSLTVGDLPASVPKVGVLMFSLTVGDLPASVPKVGVHVFILRVGDFPDPVLKMLLPKVGEFFMTIRKVTSAAVLKVNILHMLIFKVGGLPVSLLKLGKLTSERFWRSVETFQVCP